MKRSYVVLRSRRAPTRGVRSPMVGAASVGDPSAPPMTSMKVDVVDAGAAANAVADSDFEAAAPSMPMKLIGPVATAAAPSATGTAWGVTAVGADTSPFDGSGIVVAVLDTGIDATHPAFTGVNLIQKDFTGEGNGDTHGHGTHCAGTIFGRDVNGLRIGVARGVKKALIGKVLGDSGGGSENIVSAIQWAIDEGAHVISMSLGMDFPGFQALLEADGLKKEAATSLALEGYRLNIQLFDRLAAMVNALASFRQPCMLVAAAGNESGRGDTPPFAIAASPPAVSDGFIAVAALEQGTPGFGVATFSNTGAAVSAPGVGIVSARAGGGLIAFDGTSMATPHVAGVAALWAQKLKAEGTFTAKQFAARVLASADQTSLAPSLSPDDVGAGIVRAPQ
jgi:subtilisin family serine protease